MITVKQMLQRKGDDVLTIDPEATVFDAVTLMSERNVGALVVVQQEEGEPRVCGMISERDYLRLVVVKGRTSRSTPIHEIMAREVVYGEPALTAEEVLNIMTERRFRHLPILDDNRLVGLVSIGDCVKAIIKEQKVQISTLQEYIADGYPGPANDHA
jgi:CBS domain-containing protein